MKGNLATTLQLHGTAAGSQSDGSSLIGRKYLVRDAKYGHPIGEYDNPDEAKNAMLARPYSKVTSQPDIAQTPAVRDLARKRLVKTNPDVDAGSSIQDQVAEMMEDRMFSLDKKGNGWAQYSRHDGGIWIKVFFKGNKVTKSECHIDEDGRKHDEVKKGIEGVQSFIGAWGD